MSKVSPSTSNKSKRNNVPNSKVNNATETGQSQHPVCVMKGGKCVAPVNNNDGSEPFSTLGQNKDGDTALRSTLLRGNNPSNPPSSCVEREVDRLMDCARAYCEREKFKLKQHFEEELFNKKKVIINEFRCAIEREVIIPLKRKLCDSEKEVYRLQQDLQKSAAEMMDNGTDPDPDYQDELQAELEKIMKEKEELEILYKGEMKSKMSVIPEGIASKLQGTNSRRGSKNEEKGVDGEVVSAAGSKKSSKGSKKGSSQEGQKVSVERIEAGTDPDPNSEYEVLQEELKRLLKEKLEMEITLKEKEELEKTLLAKVKTEQDLNKKEQMGRSLREKAESDRALVEKQTLERVLKEKEDLAKTLKEIEERASKVTSQNVGIQKSTDLMEEGTNPEPLHSSHQLVNQTSQYQSLHEELEKAGNELEAIIKRESMKSIGFEEPQEEVTSQVDTQAISERRSEMGTNPDPNSQYDMLQKEFERVSKDKVELESLLKVNSKFERGGSVASQGNLSVLSHGKSSVLSQGKSSVLSQGKASVLSEAKSSKALSKTASKIDNVQGETTDTDCETETEPEESGDEKNKEKSKSKAVVGQSQSQVDNKVRDSKSETQNDAM